MNKVIGVCATFLFGYSLSVFASSDLYLKITDAQGVSQVVKCPDGACVVNNLKKGKYNVAMENHATDKELATGDNSGRKPALDIIELNASIVSPRDAATGLATGRRTSTPPTVIRKDMTKGAEVIIVDDGSTLSVIGLASATTSSLPTVPPQLRAATTIKK